MKSTSRKSWQQTAQEAREKLGPSIESGYFCLVREAVQHLWPKPGQRWTPFEAHALLCELAAVAKHTRRLQSGRAFAAYEVERGQLLVTRKWLADTWQWDRQTVDRFLQQLVDQGNITTRRLSPIATLIEITSYEQLQQRKEAADAEALLDELHQLNHRAVTPNQTKPSPGGQSRRVRGSTQTVEGDQLNQRNQAGETSGTGRRKPVAPMPQPNGKECRNRKSAFHPEKPEMSGAGQGQDATTERTKMPQPLNKKKVFKKKKNNTHTREVDFSFPEKERQEEAAEVSSGAGSSGPSGSTDPSGRRSIDHAGQNVKHPAGRNGTSASGHGSNSPAGSVLSCRQLVERFNALAGTVRVRYSSVVQKAYDAQCREYPDLPQLLDAALAPRFWPLAKFGRDVTLVWLLKHPETIIEIPAGELSKPRAARNGRATAAAAAGVVAPAAGPLESRPIDPEQLLVMPPWSGNCHWDEELRLSIELLLYDQRQLQLIRQLNDCLMVEDEFGHRQYLPSLVLSGPSGIGKDMLLSHVADCDMIHRLHPTALHLEAVSLQGISDAVQPGSRFEAIDRWFGDAHTADLLILSDPERLASSPSLRGRLSQLLRGRHEASRPTWITTNCPTLAALAAALEPTADPGDRSPLERRLVTDDRHFLRAQWPAYDRVRAQLESGELPAVPYEELVLTEQEYRQQLAQLPPAERAKLQQRVELLPDAGRQLLAGPPSAVDDDDDDEPLAPATAGDLTGLRARYRAQMITQAIDDSIVGIGPWANDFPSEQEDGDEAVTGDDDGDWLDALTIDPSVAADDEEPANADDDGAQLELDPAASPWLALRASQADLPDAEDLTDEELMAYYDEPLDEDQLPGWTRGEQPAANTSCVATAKPKSKSKPKAKPAAKAKAQPPKSKAKPKPQPKTKANPGRSLRKPTRSQPPAD